MCKNCKLQGLFICGEKIRGTGNYTQKTGNDKCSVKKNPDFFSVSGRSQLLSYISMDMKLHLWVYIYYYMRIIMATDMNIIQAYKVI